MKTMFKSILPLAVLVAASLLVSGCASSPESRFYVFAPGEGWAAVASRDAAETTIAVQFLPVKLPDYLDRPHIVTRGDGNQILFSQVNRWGIPLDVAVTEIVGASIARKRTEAYVDVVPVRRQALSGYLVDISVVRLDGRLGGSVELIAQWIVTKGGDRRDIVSRRLVRYEEPTGGEGYESYVEAVRKVLAKMGEEIATQGIR